MSGALATACCLLTVIPAHSLPDGHLERGVQVLVFPQRLEIHYRLGLTDAQVIAELRSLGDSEAPQDNAAAALLRFRELTADVLPSQLSVRIDGESRPVSFRDVYREERHHVRFVVVCEADISVNSQPVRIEVRDETPSGAAAIECRRMALRGRRGVEVTASTGEAALVRVPRKPVPAGSVDVNHPTRRVAAFCRLERPELELGVAEKMGTGTTSPPAAESQDTDAARDAPRKEPAAPTDSLPPHPADGASPLYVAPFTVWFVIVGLLLTVSGIRLFLSMKKPNTDCARQVGNPKRK